FILTTLPYVDVLSRCPYLDGVLLDRRLPRWNIYYLLKLKKMLVKYNFSHVYDLQNSSRTSFYRKYLLRSSNWSSTETTLKKGEKKKDFDNESVLERFKIQLDNSNIKTNYSLKPDFTWASVNVDKIVNKYFGKKFILFFPFCSPQLSHKKWPYFNELVRIIKSKHLNLEVAVAPASDEIEVSKKIESISIMNNDEPLNIIELAGLILKASYVVANDTGPAHMAAHLGKSGVVLFGYHTTAKKVSIETEKFKAITVDDLNDLTAEKVYLEIKDKLELIN
ncbi:MAG TPA: lipopolysaccharide heptosyltransferase family protein, partial [Pelagibacteraceae bacterium]|nr:lipopolysaccharide heptosyltransferase family protein [Pelagibacteraceae bacterium]